MHPPARSLFLTLLLLQLAACGGGGGGGSGSSPNPPPGNVSAPKITSIFPASVTAGGFDTTLYVTGANFASGSIANFNGSARQTQVLSNSMLQVTVPASDTAQTGSGSLTVTAGSDTSNAMTLTVAAATYTLRQIPLTAPSDLAWNSSNNVLYVLFSGNELAVLDPASGALRMLSTPGFAADHLAISDDNQFLYLFERGGAVERLLLPGLTFDISIPNQGTANDVKVAPGSPHTIAVSESGPKSVMIFDDDVARPSSISSTVTLGGDSLEITWGADASSLYGRDIQASGNTFYAFAVDPNGVSLRASQVNPVVNGAPATGIVFDPSQGLVHLGTLGNWSQAIDPVAVQWAGRLDAPGLASIDPVTKSAFFVFYTAPANATIARYDLTTQSFVSAISYPESGTGAGPRAVRWGTDGLAYLTAAGITLVNGSFVADPAPNTSAAPVNISTLAGQQLVIVPQPANGLAWNAADQLIYLSVPGSDPIHGNSIAAMNPISGKIVAAQHALSDPQRLAISRDGSYVYAGLTGSGSIERFALPGLLPDIQLPLGWVDFVGNARVALDLDGAPGSPHTFAAAIGTTDPVTPAGFSTITIFDDATPRSASASQIAQPYNAVQWGADSSTLFSADGEDTGWILYSFSVNAAGLAETQLYRNVFQSFFAHIHYDASSGLVYGDEGSAVNPVTGLQVGTFGASGLVAVDGSLNRAWTTPQQPFAGTSGDLVISSFNLTSYAPIASLTIPNVQGRVIQLIRWGTNGLAFNTEAGLIYLVSGSFVQ